MTRREPSSGEEAAAADAAGRREGGARAHLQLRASTVTQTTTRYGQILIDL
jgi:hypothetical protein